METQSDILRELTDQDKAYFQKVTAEAAGGINKGDWEPYLNRYAENIIVMPPNAETLNGREAAEEFFYANPSMLIEFPIEEIIGSTEHANVRGTYLITDHEGNFVDKGKYLSVWQKSENGSWKLTRDIWNSDAPVQVETVSATPEEQEKELQEVMARIKEQNKRIEKFYLNGQADSLGLVFSKDVKQYLAHQPPTNNLDELIENIKLMTSWGTWEFDFTTEEVKASGLMAVERGRYQYTFTPNEDSPLPATVDYGNYVVLWEKTDGDWKIVWDAPVTEIPIQ